METFGAESKPLGKKLKETKFFQVYHVTVTHSFQVFMLFDNDWRCN